MYCPDLDDAVVPINYVTTFILDANTNRPNKEKLENMSSRNKIKEIWKLLNEENELKDCFSCESLWDRPSLRCDILHNIHIILINIISRKSWAEAERLRKIGNSKYAKCLLVESLKTYNQALSFLPGNMKTGEKNILALLLANRSLVLHQLGHHKAALHDIKRSLEAGYPDRLDII